MITRRRSADPDRDLRVPTPAERLFIARVRAAASQSGFAAALGVRRAALARLEAGRTAALGAGEAAALGATLVDQVTLGERLLLARRRAGTPVREVCDALGISRPTLYADERRGTARLARYWAERGFVLAPDDDS